MTPVTARLSSLGTRALALGLWGLAVLVGCSSAPEVPLVPTNRVVLAELFTWQRCGYCPCAARTLDSLAREFRDSVVVVAYHRRVAGDTLSPDYVETRRALYYDVGGEPATVFDGGPPVRTPGPELNYTTFRSYILTAKSVTPKAQLHVDAELDSAGGTITVTAGGVDSTPSESLRLFVVVTEDGIGPTQAGATDSVFNSVMRAMLPDVSGRAIQLLRADTATFEERFALPESWNPQRLSAVAVIQDMSTGKVMQTAFCRRFESQGDR